MFRKSKIHLVSTFAMAAAFAAINASVNLAMAATAEGSHQGQAGIDFVDSYTPTHTESQYVSPIKPYDAAATIRPKAITLAAMPTHELDEKRPVHKIGAPTIVSVPRAVADTDTAVKTASRMQWTTSALGNRVGAIRIKSTDAKGVLIGVLVEKLPSEAMLRFHADKSGTALHVSAADILARIQANVDAGDKTDFGRTYWAPIFDNNDVTMEIELPADIGIDTVQISIPLIAHVFVSPAELDEKALNEAKTSAGTCNLDATCYPEYDNESRSVAKLYFLVSPGSAALCTGTLLNNRFSDGTPYLLTADHCISTQTMASNLIAIKWLHRTSACSNGIESTPIYQTGGGAILLHSSPLTDTSFLRLNERPPSVVRFAGWSAEPVTNGEFALGLHNPGGGLQEASLGKVAYYLTCTNSGGNCFVGGTMATHIGAEWTGGSIAGGSSGSGLFVTKNNARYLVGQLFGGHLCASPILVKGVYGRFDVPYRAALKTWLSPDELILRNGFE